MEGIGLDDIGCLFLEQADQPPDGSEFDPPLAVCSQLDLGHRVLKRKGQLPLPATVDGREANLVTAAAEPSAEFCSEDLGPS